MVLITLTMLATLLALSLNRISQSYTASMHASSWGEALNGAESGVDIAMTALNTNDWTGWTVSGSTKTCSTTLSHGGEGNTSLRLEITVDSPASLLDTTGQWYRIRATGKADVPGPRRLPYDALDVHLRKVSLQRDRSTGAALTQPEVMRTVEAVARPLSLFSKRGVTLKGSINMSSGSWIDSFDSGDSTKSTGGLYDTAKRQSHGDIGVINATGSDLKGMYVYGDIAYSGSAIKNTSKVQGTITTPFSETIPPVIAPTWTASPSTPTSINSSATLAGGPASAPMRYKVTKLNVPGGNTLTWTPHAAGQESYVEVWITGNMSTWGNGSIVQQPGVHVTYFVEGNVSVSGKTFDNQSKRAQNMALNLINPPVGTAQTVTVSGSGTFIGTMNAPAANITLSGSAKYSGAFIGNTLSMSLGAGLHYDEAFKSGWGGNVNYVLASWVEGTW